MRFTMLPAVALLGTACLFSGAMAGYAQAQSSPSAEQIVKSLSPTDISGASRGIRVGKAVAGHPNAQPAQVLPSASLSVLFATGSAELTPAATKTLDALGQALTDTRLAGSKFRIEGHTDTVGTVDANEALSKQRAQAVADYLVTAHHIDRSKLEPVGVGQQGLLVPTPPQTPEARNRRVVVVNLGG